MKLKTLLLIFILFFSLNNLAIAEEEQVGEENQEQVGEENDEGGEENDEGGEENDEGGEENDGIFEALQKLNPAYVGKLIMGAMLEKPKEKFEKNTALMFSEIDRLIFNVSGFTEEPLFKDHKYVFAGVGLFTAIIAVLSTFPMVMVRGGNIDEELKYAVKKFFLFFPAVLLVMYFAVGATKVTDIISANMLSVVVGNDKYVENVKLFYDFMDKNDVTNKELKEATLNGERVSGGAIVYSFLYKALDIMNGEENEDGEKRYALGFFMSMLFMFSFYLVVLILWVYSMIRIVVIIAIVLMSPFLLALPVFPMFKTINVFGLILSICLQHLAMIFGIAITFLYFADVENSEISMLVAPIIMFFGIFGIMYLFTAHINAGARAPMNYNSGVAYVFKRYRQFKKVIK